MLSGSVSANGGNWPFYQGSGGAIRLVADTVAGNGQLRASSCCGQGRIRVEANSVTLADPGNPAYTLGGVPGGTAVLWPADTAPVVRVVSVGAQNVPTDPRASLDFPMADVLIGDPSQLRVLIEGKNVPLNWVTEVRVVPKVGSDFRSEAWFMGGDETLSTWEVRFSLPGGFSAIQARAYDPSQYAASASEEGPAQSDGTEEASSSESSVY